MKELGLGQNTTGTNKAYIQVNKTNNQVVSGQTTFLQNQFDLGLDEGKKKLLNIYWTPWKCI